VWPHTLEESAEVRAQFDQGDEQRPAYDQTRQALQEALQETLERREHYHPHSAAYMDLDAEVHPLRAELSRVDSVPERLDIDTSDPEMGASWQQTLAQLQARLDAMEQGAPAVERAQDHHQDEGMGY
jgi:hypothetical protein